MQTICSSSVSDALKTAFVDDNKQARYSQGYAANRILTGSETKTKSASDSAAFLALQSAHSKGIPAA